MNDELKQAAASLMADTKNREAFAEMIVEYINPGHITTDFVGMLLNTRSMKPGDSLVKKVRKGVKVHTLVPGSIPLASEITLTERMNYILDGSIVSVTFNEWELQAGEIGTVEFIRSEMQAKLRDHIMNKVFTALTTVWTTTNTPDNFTDVGGVVTKTALDNMIEQINETTGSAKAIVGTRAALQPIMSFIGWDTFSSTDAMLQDVSNELRRTGWVGQYLGTPLVVIRQDYDNPEDYNALIPTDKILVVGENVGEFVNFGTPQVSDWIDQKPVPPQWYLRLFMQYGMIIDNAQGIGVLKVA